MRYALTLCLIVGFFTTSSAQSWRVDLTTGLAGFPQKDTKAGLQLGATGKYGVQIFPSTAILLGGGVIHQQYTDKSGFFTESLSNEVLESCHECVITNEQYGIKRTALTALVEIEQQIGRFQLAASLALDYDLRVDLQQAYFPLQDIDPREPRSIRSFRENERIGNFSNGYRTYVMSTNFPVSVGLTLKYKLAANWAVGLGLREMISTYDYSVEHYRFRSAVVPFEEKVFWNVLGNGRNRSLALNLTYRW